MSLKEERRKIRAEMSQVQADIDRARLANDGSNLEELRHRVEMVALKYRKFSLEVTNRRLKRIHKTLKRMNEQPDLQPIPVDPPPASAYQTVMAYFAMFDLSRVVTKFLGS